MSTSVPYPSCWTMFIFISISLLGNACSPFPTLPARPQAMILLTLEVPPLPTGETPKKKSVLTFGHVEAVSTLRSTHIWYRKRGPVVHRYAHHRWLALPAELIDQAFMESLAVQLPYANVVRPEQGLASDRTLSLTLLRLEQEFVSGDQSFERLEMLAQLSGFEHGRVIATHHFRYREAAPEATAVGGAVAAGAALGRLFNDLRIWLSEVDP